MSDFNLWFLVFPAVAAVVMVMASQAESEEQRRRLSLWGGALLMVFAGTLLAAIVPG